MDRSFTSHSRGFRRKRIQKATAALFYRSNWINALLADFLVIFFCGGILFLTTTAHAFFIRIFSYLGIPSAVSSVCSVLCFTAVVLLLVPLLFGALTFFYDLYLAYENDAPTPPPIAVVFSGYASVHTLLRAIGAVFLFLPLLLLLAIVGALAYFAFDLIRSLMVYAAPSLPLQAVIYAIVGLTILLVLLCVLVTYARFAPSAFLLIKHPTRSVTQCFKAAFFATQGHLKDTVLLCLSFLLLMIPSILSAGVFFFIYVLPYTIFLYLSFCYALTEE